MLDEVKNALEHQTALLALVVQVVGANVTVIGELTPFSILCTFSLVLIVLSSLLSGILEPHYNDSSWQTKQVRELFKFIIFRVGIGIKEVLQYPKLVICEPRP